MHAWILHKVEHEIRTLNQSKTEFMLIGSRQRIKTLQFAPSLSISGVSVRQVAHTKSLGTHIDENLS